MNSKRLSTIHDLSTLRLHPDGSRVLNSDANLRPRQSKYSTRDTRGNWIARDAGGKGVVKTRRTVRKQQDVQDEEVVNLSRGEEAVADEKETNEEEFKTASDVRARKRRKFAEDLEFLTPTPSCAVAVSDSLLTETPASTSLDSSRRLPPPSSDLLKYIHYFASNYYNEAGQLYDATREARRERRRKRLLKLQPAYTMPPAQLPNKEQSDDEHEFSLEDEDEMGTQEDDETGKHDTSRTRRPSINTDMYKSFDGSALMVIGMLMQEYITELVAPNISEGWEAAMVAEDMRVTRSASKKREKNQLKGNKDSKTNDPLQGEEEAQSSSEELEEPLSLIDDEDEASVDDT